MPGACLSGADALPHLFREIIGVVAERLVALQVGG